MSDLQAKPGTANAAPAAAAQAAKTAPATAEPAKAKRVAKSAEELTKTQNFQVLLQEKISKLLGQKVSRQTVWNLYKECFDSMVEFVSSDADKRLPLAGVGRFYIRMAAPRKPVAVGGVERVSKYAALKEIPHLRWKPSSRYSKYLLKKICGYEEKTA